MFYKDFKQNICKYLSPNKKKEKTFYVLENISLLKFVIFMVILCHFELGIFLKNSHRNFFLFNKKIYANIYHQKKNYTKLWSGFGDNQFQSLVVFTLISHAFTIYYWFL